MAMCRLPDLSALLILRFNLGDRVRRMVSLTFTHGDCVGSVLDWSIIDEQPHSDVIWPLLKNPKTYDIRGTKNTGFIGAIGESIAWQYLWDKGIAAEALGANPSFFGGVGPKDRSRLVRE